MSLNILIIEDESLAAKHLEMAFRRKGYNPTVAGTARDGLAAARAAEPDVALLDLNLPDRSGLEVLAELRRDCPRCEVVVNTGVSDVDVAVQAMRAGAFDYVVKPLNLDAILLTVERVLAARELKRENRFLREQYESQFSLEHVGIYGPMLAEVFENATRFAPRELPVLIQGESGTGKELVARHLHARSSPPGKGPGPFIPINCSALPVSLAESEFFGYGPGAFTGAERKGKPGKFAAADGGSIFLDEVGELVPEVQAKLLRFLETRAFYPVGLNREVRVDVKVICATNRNLAEEVAAGRFRKDLFFRINVGQITIPPLRERRREILPLLNQFLREFSAAYRRPRIRFSPEAEKLLERSAWPGNVRELKNLCERVVLVEQGPEIAPSQLRELRGEFGAEPPASAEAAAVALPSGGFDLERHIDEIVLRAFEANGGNQSRTARYLNITQEVLRHRLKKLSLLGAQKTPGAAD